MIHPETSTTGCPLIPATRTGRGMGLWILTAVVFGVAFFSGSTALRAQDEDPVILELDKRVIDFFLSTATYGAAAADALDTLLEGSPLNAKTAEIAALAEKTDGLAERYGNFFDAERIAAKRVGNDLVVMKYLYKCERFPVVWYFTFYRTSTRGDRPTETSSPWHVIIVRFDTELELLALDGGE